MIVQLVAQVLSEFTLEGGVAALVDHQGGSVEVGQGIGQDHLTGVLVKRGFDVEALAEQLLGSLLMATVITEKLYGQDLRKSGKTSEVFEPSNLRG